MVVGTRNRVGLLAECLASLERQEISLDRFEIIVVDNGSTDATPTLLRDWAAAEPTRRRVVTEPRAGISRARNRGVEEARHEIVLFIDDDALAHETWVEAHLARYAATPEVGAVGGPVVLSWPNGRPSWLGPELEQWFSALDIGPERVTMILPLHPYGANMSMRRAELIAESGFALELGRRGSSLISNEEYELVARLARRGVRVEWEPSAVVTHQMASDRLRRRWVLRRGWAQGRGLARMRRLSGVPSSPRTTWEEARAAAADLGDAANVLRSGSSSAILNDIALRSAHLAAAAEHLWLWTGDVVAQRRRGLDSRPTGQS